MLMGALFKILKVKTKNKNRLSIKAQLLIYFPRTLEKNELDKIFQWIGVQSEFLSKILN